MLDSFDILIGILVLIDLIFKVNVYERLRLRVEVNVSVVEVVV